MLGVAIAASARDNMNFDAKWWAQADHGRIYWPMVDGTYKKYGPEGETEQGGPLVNNLPFLATGKIDLMMGGNLPQGIDNAKNGLPTVAVAAIFQRDPQARIAHPGQPITSGLDSKKRLTGPME